MIQDIEIIRKIRSGNREAYADLVRKYQGRVLQLCVSILSDPHEAEDAAQEVFIRAYQSLDKFRGSSSYFTWLYRIAVNHCLDLLRDKSRHSTESWEALLEKEGDQIHRLISAPAGYDTSKEDSDLIERVLSCLSSEYRMVLTLREIQGLSYQEIAEVLDCSLDSVKARLQRARRAFEDKLRHFLGPENV